MKYWTTSVSIIALGALAACSGGGGGSSSTNSAPTVTAGADQAVIEGVTVTLTATVSDADGDTVTVSWAQTAGDTVTLSDTSALSPTFVAPAVNADTVLTFSVTASDGQESATDEVSISVDDVSVQDVIDKFELASMTATPSAVSCTLSDGTASTCLSLTLDVEPGGNYTIGPWCPRNIADTAADGGIWLENSEVNDVDGAFIENLATFYNDSNWQMFDPTTGDINYTETAEECDAAARPQVDPALQNHCVECRIAFLDAGITQSYLIPLSPSQASSSTSLRDAGGVGIAYSGILFDQAAPVEAILSAYTIAPFDDCGGHVNPVVGYHMHAVTDDCLAEYSENPAHAAQIGLALDGYAMYERLDPDGTEPSDLDSCRGHTTEAEGYHYHVGAAGSNEILPCLSGKIPN